MATVLLLPLQSKHIGLSGGDLQISIPDQKPKIIYFQKITISTLNIAHFFSSLRGKLKIAMVVPLSPIT